MPPPDPRIYKIFTTSDERVSYVAKEEVNNPSSDFDLHSGKKQRFDHFFVTSQDSAIELFVNRLSEEAFSTLTRNSDLDYIPIARTPNGYVVHVAEGAKSVLHRRIINYGFVDTRDLNFQSIADFGDVFQQRLKKIIQSVGTKNLTSALSSTPALLSWIKDQTNEFNPANVNEMAYIILKKEPTKKECDRYPKFNSYEKGYYEFCGAKNKCACLRKASSERQHEIHKTRDKNYYHQRSKKSKETAMRKWGVENVMQSPVVQQKHKESCLRSLGCETPFRSPATRQKAKETCKRRRDRNDRQRVNSVVQESAIHTCKKEISQWLDKSSIDYKREQKFGLGNQSLDFVIEDRLAIEFNGLYSHSQFSAHGKSRQMDRNYHKRKTDQCNKIGYQLLSIFEDEWNNSKELIKEKILTTLGYGTRGVVARKTTIKHVAKKDADEFLNRYHLQGTTASSVRLGAYYKQELVALMTFKKDRNEWTLVRFVNDNRSHPGVFSKLLKHFERQHVGETIVSFSDNRWSKGDVYLKNGFSKICEIKPDYSVTDYVTREHKFNWRKSKIARRFDVDVTGKTELELTLELGYDRIWDCGKVKWKKIATN